MLLVFYALPGVSRASTQMPNSPVFNARDVQTLAVVQQSQQITGVVPLRVISLTTATDRGAEVAIAATTRAFAQCTVSLNLPTGSGRPIEVNSTVVADGSGQARTMLTIPLNASPGFTPLTVGCGDSRQILGVTIH